jgi:hypothetical protein
MYNLVEAYDSLRHRYVYHEPLQTHCRMGQVDRTTFNLQPRILSFRELTIYAKRLRGILASPFRFQTRANPSCRVN